MALVGLLGGTFDPVHNGHLQLAEAVLARCGLDRILFIPAAAPPHKINASICPIKCRLEMVRLAVESLPRCTVSELEASPDRISYTIETLRTLRSSQAREATYFFIIGGDAFLEIETWHRWPELLASTSFIVALRQGYPLQDLHALLDHHHFYKDSENQEERYHGQHGTSVLLLSAPIDEISSTDIRRRIAHHQAWRHLVPQRVATYIDEHRLYLRSS
ncbi:MAG: nicotinate (nicotinamide) nucleotide adenylyltransferase [Desulfofustis sp.]|nr:nicotinate (nicotinamide) nucleotide adenylyltransferase [Desulfofustis sp.]